jgi:hypothetical protein
VALIFKRKNGRCLDAVMRFEMKLPKDNSLDRMPEKSYNTPHALQGMQVLMLETSSVLHDDK